MDLAITILHRYHHLMFDSVLYNYLSQSVCDVLLVFAQLYKTAIDDTDSVMISFRMLMAMSMGKTENQKEN